MAYEINSQRVKYAVARFCVHGRELPWKVTGQPGPGPVPGTNRKCGPANAHCAPGRRDRDRGSVAFVGSSSIRGLIGLFSFAKECLQSEVDAHWIWYNRVEVLMCTRRTQLTG